MHPLHVAVQVSSALSLTGGVQASAVAQPSIGVLLRLAVACPLGVPLSSVTITALNSSTESQVLLPDVDPVNVAEGNCSSLRSSSASTGALRARQLSSSGTLVVSLAVVVCASSQDPSANVAVTLLTAILVNASTASGASGNASSIAFTAFLAAAALSSGTSAADARLSISMLPAAQVAGESAAGGNSAGTCASCNASIIPIVAGVVVGVIAAAIIVALLVAVHIHRSKMPSTHRRLHLEDVSHGGDAETTVFAANNPMVFTQTKQ